MGNNSVIKINGYTNSVLSSVKHSKNGAFIHHYEMDYDVMMRLRWIDDCVNGSGYTNYYAYDSYGRLIREDNGHVGYTFLYTYDNSGNITKVQKYNYSESATPSGTPTENTFTYDTTHTDRLAKFNNKSITYDNNGCIKTYDGWTYTWNKGKLSSIQKGGTVSARAFVGGSSRKYTFTYNGYGQRTEKKYTYFPGLNNERDYLASCTSSYTYDLQGRLLSDNRVSRYDDGTTNTKSFTFLYEGAEIVGVIFTNYAGTGTYYYDKNPLGDVIGILDNSGNTVVKYKYDAYGNCTRGASSNYDLADSNPIRYRSYYYDEDTGLYYLNARYYNPEWRRFISPDDTAYLDIESANGLNLYAYCNNDPVNNIDPSGHEWYNPLTWNWEEIAKGVGLIITGVGAIAIGIVTLPYGGWISAVAGITVLAGGGTTLFGLSHVGEGITDYNVIQEAVFMGNENAYNITESIFAITATIGSMICGRYIKYHTTTTPRSLPGKGQKPHSGVWNINDKTLGYYGSDGKLRYSIAFNNHNNPSAHSIPHWHTELPHSEPINSFWRFVVELIKRGF